MSYDIYIGEGVIEPLDITEPDGNELRVVVKKLICEDAPFFKGDGMTGKSNARHPGYSQFSTFLQEAGIYELFFDQDTGLMREHPGAFLIRDEDLKELTKAKERYIADNPDVKAGWGIGECPILARLVWFEWWFKYALTNCTMPTIYNR